MRTITCLECKATKETNRLRVRYCSRLCHDRHKARKARRAAAIYDLLIEWRTTRGAKKGALGEIAHQVDGWITKDKERKHG